jgi:hypothetical protein
LLDNENFSSLFGVSDKELQLNVDNLKDVLFATKKVRQYLTKAGM